MTNKGDKFGSLTIMDDNPVCKEGTHEKLWRVQCICGKEYIRSLKNIKRRLSDKCKCRNIRKVSIGDVYGPLTVIAAPNGTIGKVKILVRCKCGKEFWRFKDKVVLSNGDKCICARVVNIAKGTKLGPVTILDPTPIYKGKREFYKVQCVCGKVNVRARSVMTSYGDDTRCRCVNSVIIRKGDVYGAYTVLDDTPVFFNNNIRRYKVRCECGEIMMRTHGVLINKATTSCKCPPSTKIKQGDVFGNYTILSTNPLIRKCNVKWQSPTNVQYALCRCICGNERRIRMSKLLDGTAVSCGCSTTEYRISQMTSIDDTRVSLLPLYPTWTGIMDRCYNPDNHSYRNYGAKGIKVSEELQDVYNFNRLLLPGWKPGLSLDRIDYNGDYAIDNLRWATSTTQSENRAVTCRSVDPFTGETMLLTELAEKYHVSYKTLRSRYHKNKHGIELFLSRLEYYKSKFLKLTADEQADICKVVIDNSPEEAAKLLELRLIDVLIIKHLNC